ncbi:ABC transporter substrate-binding protein [Bradyrhizobium sp. NP1]|uniref:ABC transporter substrate-binding protein n=1 Tax=Bradyrhizobium sp. NP1 TaxID=3049772 RepID=UPI0025A5BB2E|nr:ABC transporter substrate-binding protein [Bradyrhizobium sp. NP1]WJR77279.1 ABC transporter substrate-binding protein [Bradyrhizobium sp. NP1]
MTRRSWVASLLIAAAVAHPSGLQAAEIRIAEQFSLGYLEFIIMKRDRLIEKYAEKRGIKDPKVTWMRFNGPSTMNEALLSNSADVVAGGVPGLVTLWDKTRGTALEVKGICALSSQPFLLNTSRENVKTIADFTDKDRIAMPSVKVSVQAVMLQMAAAKTFGDKDFAKLDPLTVSMTPPDSTLALMGGAGGITAVFSVPPFQFQQVKQPNIHTVLSSFDVLGPHTFSVAWTTARFRKDNPELYGAFLDAVDEATRTINADPKLAAETWIKDTNSNLKTDFVAEIIAGKDVTWTRVPQANLSFAKFMHRVGSIKADPESWKDLYFPEIHDLPGS